ncbi:MAG TPA: histidine kinase [Burkholderiaceae bacterium]|nr:histidine kinase [Burkholderiaceae bacterium]
MKASPPAIKGPLARAETAIPTPRRVVPDGCNMGVLMRVIGIVVALTLTAAVADAASPAEAVSAFLNITALAAPATLTTLMLWCAERRALPLISVPLQRAIAWLTPGLVAYAFTLALRGDAGPWVPIGHALAGAALGAGVQHYYELRERAFSPAVVEAKYQALQSRIRPHFLFNSLNAVLAVIRSEPAKAERMLESIAELFRAVMADTRRLVPLAQEIELCRNYVEIEQTRLGNRLAVDWQIGAYHPRAKVPQLLLQPVIENAIRYGAETLPGRADIIVRVRQHGFTLEMFVSNPIAPERPEREGNQIGLANIRGRLALIYDLEAKVETQVRRDRFELTMTLPVERRA